MEVVVKRYSCRTYRDDPLRQKDKEFFESLVNRAGSLFGTKMRFMVVMSENDNQSGKFGTYGMIKHAQGFIAGLTYDTRQGLIDCGYELEQIILGATEHMIGT